MAQVGAVRKGRRASCKAVAWSSGTLRVVPGVFQSFDWKSATKGLTGFVVPWLRLHTGNGLHSLCHGEIRLEGVCRRQALDLSPASEEDCHSFARNALAGVFGKGMCMTDRA